MDCLFFHLNDNPMLLKVRKELLQLGRLSFIIRNNDNNHDALSVMMELLLPASAKQAIYALRYGIAQGRHFLLRVPFIQRRRNDEANKEG
jgi:hypothetical protein